MKKLMIAAAIVCAAAYAQAATIAWDSASFPTLESCVNGSGVGYADEGPACVTAYLWTFSAVDWNSAYETSAGVYNAFQAGTLTAASSATAEWVEGVAYFNTGTTTAGDAMANNTQYYAAALFLHSDEGTDPDYYIGNWATALASDLGGSATDLGDIIGGGSSLHTGTESTVWTAASAAPEPTSGLLLLLGVAGLALRRRRA